SLNIQMELSERDRALVSRYQSVIAQYYASKSMTCDFITPKFLHVSISNPFMGTELLQGNLRRDLQAFDRPLTLQYADTDSDDATLVINFHHSSELDALRKGVERVLAAYRITLSSFSPHMGIGKQHS